jgi:hypothetical protein
MKTLTEIAIECGAQVMPKSESGLTTKLTINESKLQAFVDAVNARDSEPVYQVAMNGTWFDTNLVGYIKHSGVKRTLFTSQPNDKAEIARLREILAKCDEAMSWELGGEPLPTLMLEARKLIKDALAMKGE